MEWGSFINGLVSSIIGAMVGGGIAYLIALKTINITLMLSKPEFIHNFQDASPYINRYIRKSQKISKMLEEEHLNDGVKLMGIQDELRELDDYMMKIFLVFDSTLTSEILKLDAFTRIMKISREAPPNSYKTLNGFFIKIISTRNLLNGNVSSVFQDKNKIEIIGIAPDLHHDLVIKDLEKTYEVLNGKLKIL